MGLGFLVFIAQSTPIVWVAFGAGRGFLGTRYCRNRLQEFDRGELMECAPVIRKVVHGSPARGGASLLKRQSPKPGSLPMRDLFSGGGGVRSVLLLRHVRILCAEVLHHPWKLTRTATARTNGA